jgi:hypothetical protein
MFQNGQITPRPINNAEDLITLAAEEKRTGVNIDLVLVWDSIDYKKYTYANTVEFQGWLAANNYKNPATRNPLKEINKTAENPFNKFTARAPKPIISYDALLKIAETEKSAPEENIELTLVKEVGSNTEGYTYSKKELLPWLEKYGYINPATGKPLAFINPGKRDPFQQYKKQLKEGSKFAENDFNSSITQDLLTNPVSLPCIHLEDSKHINSSCHECYQCRTNITYEDRKNLIPHTLALTLIKEKVWSLGELAVPENLIPFEPPKPITTLEELKAVPPEEELVIVATGMTYEKSKLLQWFKNKEGAKDPENENVTLQQVNYDMAALTIEPFSKYWQPNLLAQQVKQLSDKDFSIIHQYISAFICPAEKKYLKIPVVIAGGHTVERSSVVGALGIVKRSPIDQKPLVNIVIPNLLARSFIETYQQKVKEINFEESSDEVIQHAIHSNNIQKIKTELKKDPNFIQRLLELLKFCLFLKTGSLFSTNVCIHP